MRRTELEALLRDSAGDELDALMHAVEKALTSQLERKRGVADVLEAERKAISQRFSVIEQSLAGLEGLQ